MSTMQYAITHYSAGHLVFDRASTEAGNKAEALQYARRNRIPRFYGITTVGRVIEFATAAPDIGIPTNPAKEAA